MNIFENDKVRQEEQPMTGTPNRQEEDSRMVNNALSTVGRKGKDRSKKKKERLQRPFDLNSLI